MTHHIDEALAIADKIVLMNKGALHEITDRQSCTKETIIEQMRGLFMNRQTLLIVAIILGFNWVISFSTTGSDLFTTWDGLETDKLASIWLIQRFISPGADVKFYPRNHVISDGVQFDTPLFQNETKVQPVSL